MARVLINPILKRCKRGQEFLEANHFEEVISILEPARTAGMDNGTFPGNCNIVTITCYSTCDYCSHSPHGCV